MENFLIEGVYLAESPSLQKWFSGTVSFTSIPRNSLINTEDKEVLSSVQSLSRVQLFATLWIAARQASLSITISQSSLKFTSIESVMPSSHLILCRPLFLLPQSLPASESFPMSQLFAWGGQNTGVSALASFLPKNTQGWSPLEWTGWISLQVYVYVNIHSYICIYIIHISIFHIQYRPQSLKVEMIIILIYSWWISVSGKRNFSKSHHLELQDTTSF